MPYCKNCHKEITKFDTDICPYCGEEKPIDENYVTMDMTQHIDPQAKGYKLYKSKSHRLFSLLCLFFGYFGIHNFYLGFTKRGFIDLGVTVFIVAGAGCVLFFTKLLANAWAFLIPFFALWIFYIALGIVYFRKDSLKDSNGEFLR